MKPACQMTEAELTLELNDLDRQFNTVHEDDEGDGGSPGEWMVERMGKIETELKRRLLPKGTARRKLTASERAVLGAPKGARWS